MNAMVLDSPTLIGSRRPNQLMMRPAPRTAGLLTRRGWAVVTLALGLVLGAAYLAGMAMSNEAVYVPTDSVVVHQGDTLWSIAEQRTTPGGDVRQTVALIKSLNQLKGVGLVAGDQLWVPYLP